MSRFSGMAVQITSVCNGIFVSPIILLDIGKELRTGQVPDDQQHLYNMSMSLILNYAQKLTLAQKVRLDSMTLTMNAMMPHVERTAMKKRIKTRKTLFLARSLL